MEENPSTTVEMPSNVQCVLVSECLQDYNILGTDQCPSELPEISLDAKETDNCGIKDNDVIGEDFTIRDKTQVKDSDEASNVVDANLTSLEDAIGNVNNDNKEIYHGHRTLVANYQSDASSSDSDGTLDSEPDSSNESSGSSSSSEDDIVDKVIKPVEEITITVPKEAAQIMGTIKYIVDDQVIVQPLVELAALDLATILFLDEGARALGKIEDVIGPITEPIYCVNFSSAKDIECKQIVAGMTVYYAPKTDHTAFVPIPTLMKQKGSDASWEHNEEVPDDLQDFSDDEEEAKLNQANRGDNQSQKRRIIASRQNPRNRFERRSGRGNNRGSFQRNVQPGPPPMHYQQLPRFPHRFPPPPNYFSPHNYFQQQAYRPPPPPGPPIYYSPFAPNPNYPPPGYMPGYNPPNR